MALQVRPVSIRHPRRGLRPSRRVALVLAALVAGASVTGCGISGPEAEGRLELTSGSTIDDVIGPLWEDGGERALADVFAHEVQNASFGPEVRIVAPGAKQLIILEG